MLLGRSSPDVGVAAVGFWCCLKGRQGANVCQWVSGFDCEMKTLGSLYSSSSRLVYLHDHDLSSSRAMNLPARATRGRDSSLQAFPTPVLNL